MSKAIDTSKILFVENLDKDPEFIGWVITLLKSLQQMKIEGAITGNDLLNKLFDGSDGVDVDFLLKSIEDGTEDGQKWLKAIAAMTQAEMYGRKVGQ